LRWFFGGLVLGGGFVYFTIWSNSDHELFQFHFVLLLSEKMITGSRTTSVQPTRYLKFLK